MAYLSTLTSGKSSNDKTAQATSHPSADLFDHDSIDCADLRARRIFPVIKEYWSPSSVMTCLLMYRGHVLERLAPLDLERGGKSVLDVLAAAADLRSRRNPNLGTLPDRTLSCSRTISNAEGSP